MAKKLTMKAAAKVCKAGKWKRGHRSYAKCVGSKMRGKK